MSHPGLPPAPPAPSVAAGFWDRLGVVLSGLCAVHCLALPVLLLALPCAGLGALVHEATHPAMAAFLVPVTLRAAKSAPGASLLHAGLGVVCLAVPAHAFLGECLGLALTLAGSGLLILGHRTNLFCRRAVAS
ncbi:MAG: MerC family mercury resistance protein [Rubricoccaceae bacterium]|nr:MerC family mercury resistance protein [Rubricoccaceae bacterium]